MWICFTELNFSFDSACWKHPFWRICEWTFGIPLWPRGKTKTNKQQQQQQQQKQTNRISLDKNKKEAICEKAL